MRINKKLVIVVFLVVFGIGVGSFYNLIPKGEIVEKRKGDNPTITILAGQSTSDAGTEEMIQKVLEEKFPEVNFEWICVGWAEDNYRLRLIGRYAIGNPPDIIIGKSQDAVSYAQSNVILPIPERCAACISEEEKNAVMYNGNLYGIPYTCQYQGVFYNKDIFERYGLKPPKTMRELRRIVDILESSGEVAFAGHYKEAWQVGNNTMQFFMNEIFQYNPNWGDELRQGRSTFSDNKIVQQCFQNSRYILEHSWNDALQIDQFECDERFGKGNAAMYLTGSWSLQYLSQVTQDIQIGIFPYPNEQGDAKLIKEINISFMKGASTTESELVDDILQELGSNEELAKEIADFTKGESTLEDLQDYRITEVQEDTGRYEAADQVIDVTIGNTQLIWDYQSEIAEEELLWLQGKLSLDQVMRYADENIERSVAEK